MAWTDIVFKTATSVVADGLRIGTASFVGSLLREQADRIIGRNNDKGNDNDDNSASIAELLDGGN